MHVHRLLLAKPLASCGAQYLSLKIIDTRILSSVSSRNKHSCYDELFSPLVKCNKEHGLIRKSDGGYLINHKTDFVIFTASATRVLIHKMLAFPVRTVG